VDRGAKGDTVRKLCDTVYKEKAPLTAGPSQFLTSLEASGGDSGGEAVSGNACDEWHCPCDGSASCA
jgi:hypothetical protein